MDNGERVSVLPPLHPDEPHWHPRRTDEPVWHGTKLAHQLRGDDTYVLVQPDGGGLPRNVCVERIVWHSLVAKGFYAPSMIDLIQIG